MGKALLDFARGGGLAAGSAMLLGLWFQGMHRLGFREAYPDGFVDVLIPGVVGVGLGATLGLPASARGPLWFLLRVVGVAIAGIAAAALFAIGGTLLLVSVFGIAERNLPPYFAVAGVALVAVGLRRLPRRRAARAVLGVVVGIFVVMRLLVVWPSAAHTVMCRLFPFPSEKLRTIFDHHCGAVCGGERSRVVSLDTKLVYGSIDANLACSVKADAVLEVTRPFFEDACGDVHDAAPAVPAFVRAYPTMDACVKEHPAAVWREWYAPLPSPCCLRQLTERHVGERIHVSRAWEFLFNRWKWSGWSERFEEL